MAEHLKLHPKKATRGQGDAIVFDISQDQGRSLSDILPRKTQIKKLASMSKVFAFVTGIIHGMPDLFEENISLKDLEVYLGRSSLEQVANRWSKHFNERDHLYGIVCCQVPEDTIERIEEGCVKIFKRLHSNDILCISNKSVASAGRSSSGVTVIYLTFCVDKRLKEKPAITSKDIDRIANYIDEESSGEYRFTEIESSMRRLKKHSDKVKLVWHQDHR